MKTFEELLEGLSQNNIDYILVGGLAVDICGFSRATMDVDIIVEHSKENIQKLLNCLKLFGEGSARELHPEDFSLEEGCIRIVEEFPLDVFTLMRGYTYQNLLPHSAILITERGVNIRYLNVEGLIKLKEGSMRSKDQLDVQELKKQAVLHYNEVP
ncbi:MAG: hypothetical protein HY201_05850 [Nitrospirae bacterium]|nr:hypothetical protein [Candidatus Troglogloeales bacterium]MBI3598950.1 hypothetical protein [Candidatus Troglogloeales bacterium]